jgi:Glycosyl hydrolase-like 10
MIDSLGSNRCFPINRLTRWVAIATTGCFTYLSFIPLRAQAQTQGAQPYCQFAPQNLQQKETLLRASLAGDGGARQQYQALLAQDGRTLNECRSRSWIRTQAIWLRLYECDLRPGVLDALVDRIVNRGYNQIYIEVFYSGQVLLPAANNPTPWPTVVRRQENAQRDLLAEVIQKGRERGVKVYAWLFSLNFGYTYGSRPDRAITLARNGYGKTSLDSVDSANADLVGDVDKIFVDPYNPMARQDYGRLVSAILQRRPDGVLYDYIRYPKQTGGGSVAAQIKDLWIFSSAAKQTMIGRAMNEKGRAVIQQYLQQGTLSASQLAVIDKQFPTEGEALWQGRNPPKVDPKKLPSAAVRLPRLLNDLWYLGVAHAYQGVVDFLNAAVYPVKQQGLAAGAVFFPDGNRRIRQGFDSRMQAWDRFPNTIEWHPMSYGLCADSSCISSQVTRVFQQAPSGTQVIPAIAGVWGTNGYNRPSLEAQMSAVRQAAPQIAGFSHFDFSWQDPQFAGLRRSCKLDYAKAPGDRIVAPRATTQQLQQSVQAPPRAIDPKYAGSGNDSDQ